MSNGTKTALVIGATSDIGRALTRKLAGDGYALLLAARDPERLDREARDSHVRMGVTIATHLCDVLHSDSGISLLGEIDPLPDVAICVVGSMGERREDEGATVAAARAMQTNYMGPALLMETLAERFVSRGSGILVGISSVAGDRGRGSNHIYGSAKAGFTAFLSGLRNRLDGSGVHVVTIKPGFVRTRMTEGMNLPALLTAEPKEVAYAVARAIHRCRDVVYVRRVWRPIMAIVRAIPESVFKKMKL